MFKLISIQRNAKRKKKQTTQTGIVDTEEDIIVFISACNRTYLFFSTPSVSLEDGEHLLHISKYRYT